MQEDTVDSNNWRELYRAALLELDLDKLGERVKTADEAIRARASLDGDVSSDERIAIQNAMAALNLLRQGRRYTRYEIAIERCKG
jgi:hypothetical protein